MSTEFVVASETFVRLYNAQIEGTPVPLAHWSDLSATLEELVANIEYRVGDSRISDWNTGAVVFEKLGVEVPAQWSQTALDILAQKYMRKAGVPVDTVPVFETGVPSWLQRRDAHTDCLVNDRMRGEESSREVFHRLAGCWTYWGFTTGYFSFACDDAHDVACEAARAFYLINVWMLANQWVAPNSPQWFNTGIHWAYGISAPLNGGYYWDNDSRVQTVCQTNLSYVRPQPHACFIQSIKDTLVNDMGIMDLWTREATVFKFGSGSGTNFSPLRAEGERLSSGGRSSGLMSFLKVGDASAGSIKSGGTTRRAAKMVSVNIDHPEAPALIRWKVEEENKVAALVAGSKLNAKHIGIVLGLEGDAQENAIIDALEAGVPESLINRALQAQAEGVTMDLAQFDLDWQSEAYATVSGQNANISIGIPDAFMTAMETDASWTLTGRKDPGVNRDVRARELWNDLIEAAWASADPGVQYLDTMNRMNTCKNTGTIWATNPCSEYVFLDDTACNLASMNLVAIRKGAGDAAFASAVETVSRVYTVVLDISVEMAQFPSKIMAENSYKYRTLGFGYANLGSLLMRMGLRYGSSKSLVLTEYITSTMGAATYHQSAKLAQLRGAFHHFETNREPMLEVIDTHRTHSYKVADSDGVAGALGFRTHASDLWHEAYEAGMQYGYRNAQTTVLAPTGTIGLVMDCDTTGVEPEFALVKWKSLAGGGGMNLINQGVTEALETMGVRANTQSFVVDAIMGGTPPETLDEYLSEEQIAVFDCAVPAKGGTRQLHYMDHLNVMAAAQKYLSGAISKTVNLPTNATLADIDDVYRKGHTLGLKAVALYRDGSKLSQPLMTAKLAEVKARVRTPEAAARMEVVEQVVHRLARRRPPNKRKGYTQRAVIAGHKLYHHTGEFNDGTLAEIFIDVSKEGATLRALFNQFAVAVSIGLQYGVPLEEFVDAFVHTKFEPAGMVQGHDNVRNSESMIDYLFRDLAINYLVRDDLAHIKPERIDPSGAVTPIGEITPENTVTFVSETDASTRTITPGVHAGAVIAGKKVSAADAARDAGYTGDLCSNCQSFRMKRAGSCMVCESCGTTTGCS